MFTSMWTEKLTLAIPEIKFLQSNTDGITYMIPRSKYDIAMQINDEMSNLTGLYIENNEYSKMVIRDVNNYQAVYTDSTLENEHIKLKGCFEIEKDLYKDHSMLIVPIALKQYFLYNVPIEETIRNHKDILDFCLRLKTNVSSTPYFIYYDNESGKVCRKKLDRTTRYYISNNGGELYKDFGDGKTSGVNIGFTATLFNHFVEKNMEDYNINYRFYINEANKIKEVIDPRNKELTLFD